MLHKGLKKFRQKGEQATAKEMKQLHDPVWFSTVLIKVLTPEEHRKAQEAIMFLTEKRDGTIKGRTIYNAKPTREWLDREDSTSPTVSLESMMMIASIDSKKGRDVLTADVPNTFIQADMPQGPDHE